MALQTGTAIRESIYTGSYLGLCPVLQGYIDDTDFARKGPPGTSLVVSGISAGLFASLVTQPIDTAKTRMQAFIDPKVTRPSCVFVHRHAWAKTSVSVLFAHAWLE